METPATPEGMTSAAPAFDHSQSTTSLFPSCIKRDNGIQQRARMLDNGIVAEYAEALKAGTQFPPITVYYDGADYWLADGYHRIEAAEEADLETIQAEIRPGGRRDAILFAVGANRDHGLRRTREDVRRSIETMLQDQEWGAWSDRAIAERVGCDHKTVGAVRAQLGKFPSSGNSLNGIKLERKSAPNGVGTAPQIEEIEGDSLSGIRSSVAAMRDHKTASAGQKAQTPTPATTEKRIGRDGKVRIIQNKTPPTKAATTAKTKTPPRLNAGQAMIAVRDALVRLQSVEGMLSLSDARTLAGNYRDALARLVARFPELEEGEGRQDA